LFFLYNSVLSHHLHSIMLFVRMTDTVTIHLILQKGSMKVNGD